MYTYEWDASTGGLLLTPMPLTFSKEPRPVYYKELDALGFDKYWIYDKNDTFPYMGEIFGSDHCPVGLELDL